MDFSYILHNSIPQKEKLLQFGFVQKGEDFLLKQNLDSEFYLELKLNPTEFTAAVFEIETGEKYALLDVQKAHGAFVGGMRQQVKQVVEEVQKFCFSTFELKESYVQWIEKDLGVKGDFPWEGDETSCVFRGKNTKWFALVMKIKFKNLGFESEEPVWAVNLKADADEIPKLVNHKSIFPAWHMNKKYWITIILTAVTDFEKLKKLTLRSKELIKG